MEKQVPPQPGFMAGQDFMSGQGSTPPPPPPYNDGPNVVIMGPPPAFDSESQRITCPHCHKSVSTTVETEANSKTHLFALLLCMMGCLCCVPCPYCIDSCMVKKHYCPSCKSFLGQSLN